MTVFAPDRTKTLEIAQRLSVAGRPGVAASVFLEDVCAAVAEAFEFDSVNVVEYDSEDGEVGEIAFDGDAVDDRAEAQLRAGGSLLLEAQETRKPVLVSAGPVTSAFALPLISGKGDRCLAFLLGTRRATASSTEPDGYALAAVGAIAATLLENALAREEMQELDILKSEFIALAAHELRNPVASICGISATLAERGDDLTESERLMLQAPLRDQAVRLRNLLEQLLDVSRFDLAAIRISPERIRLRPKIEELVHALVDGRSNVVTIAVPQDLEAVVDPAALDRMLSNLLANALRHGKPPVTITGAGQDRHLRLAVEDRGEGVPREFVPRLFERFARESRGHGEGSGLGLAIAQAYARAHGGEIVYYPGVPRGARFEVVIPLRGYGDDGVRFESEMRLHRID